MSAQVLYRKWRPQRFADLVGQEHVTQTLLNALATGRVAHAYLFCGPRGTGKTSMGRILAKAMNCRENGRGEPCNRCPLCLAVAEGHALDLIEVDAASNRGIEEIRSLREKVHFAPNEARYKVYIIDEVHMLTKEAFNALLKTLEEPPAHAIFVLATTEAHKLPATVISRCQRFDFRRIPLSAIVERLARIATEEGFEASQDALAVIARAAGGSLRDAINLLEQVVVSHGPQVDAPVVKAMLGLGGEPQARALAAAALSGDVGAGITAIAEAGAEGVDLAQLHRALMDYLRGLMLAKAGASQAADMPREEQHALQHAAAQFPIERIVHAVRAFAQADLRGGGQSPLALELALVEAADASVAAPSAVHPPAQPRGQPPVRSAPSAAQPAPRPSVRPAMPAPPTPRPSSPTVAETGPEPPRTQPAPVGQASRPPAPEAPAAPLPVNGAPALSDQERHARLKEQWKAFIEASKGHGRRYRLDALLRSAWPDSVQGDLAVLGFTHKNFVDMMNEELQNPATRKALEEALERVLGTRHQVRCILGQRPSGGRGHLVRAAMDELGAKIVKPGGQDGE